MVLNPGLEYVGHMLVRDSNPPIDVRRVGLG